MTDEGMEDERLDHSRFGPYEIIREVAQGKYATVYEARHSHPRLHERSVALRILWQGYDRQHFLHAARLNASLDHPRIPSLYEVAEERGCLYTARMFIDGRSLHDDIHAASPSVAEVIRIVGDIAGALDYAHARHFTHGSVHPRHVLLRNDGSAWLIGFGEYPPAEGTPLGNPAHLAPEQFEEQGEATVATDVYALTETALWLLCGVHPFRDLPILELRAAKRAGQIRSDFWRTREDISDALQQVLRRGLETEPGNRYATAGDFATAFATAGRTGDKVRRRFFWR